MTPHDLYWLIPLTLLGLAVGSFLNVVIARYPRILEQRWQAECAAYLTPNEPVKIAPYNLAVPNSHCPRCQHRLGWKDLIPICSYLLLKGDCRYCQSKISWQYPIVEILSAALFVGISLVFGLSLYAGILIILSEVLLSLAILDLNTQLLPDDFTLNLLWAGLILSATTTLTTTPAAAIFGAAIGYSLPWCVNFLYRLIRKREGMGYGDFKCFAALGAWLGIQAMPSLFILAVALGLVFGLIGLLFKEVKFQQAMPFGPAILLAGWVILMQQGRVEQLLQALLN